jgi:ABC-type dipeptide/oligopeptide/nickel transport system permease component
MFKTNPLMKYIFHRVLQAIPLLFWALSSTVLIIHLAPGDPVSFLAGQYEAIPEYIEAVRREFGLAKPFFVQLRVYLLMVIQRDLGYSTWFREPVFFLILSRIPATFLLIGTGLVLSTFFGLFLGIAYTRRSNVSENVTLLMAKAGQSMPAFWLGQILLIVFSPHLGLLSTHGMTPIRTQRTGLSAVFDVLHHLQYCLRLRMQLII